MANDQRSMPHLIVDGYNVAHAWPHIEPLFAEGSDLVVDSLCWDLRAIHDARHVRLTVVFDGKGSDLDIIRPFSDTTFSQLFSPSSMTADAVIEQLVSQSKKPDRIIVATRDQVVIDSVEANGAQCLSPELLMDWLEAAEREGASKAKRTGRRSAGDWENRLPL